MARLLGFKSFMRLYGILRENASDISSAVIHIPGFGVFPWGAPQRCPTTLILIPAYSRVSWSCIMPPGSSSERPRQDSTAIAIL